MKDVIRIVEYNFILAPCFKTTNEENEMPPKILFVAIAMIISLAIVIMPNSYAGLMVVDVSAGSGWRTTTDSSLGNQWAIGNFNSTDGVAAWAPYGNAGTTDLNENYMMWNCGADGSACENSSGTITGADGPTEVFFGFSFDIKPGAKVSNAGIAIIADDFFVLVINGQEVISATLEGNQKPNGQPDPLILDFAMLSPFFQTGTNVLAIRAMDGFLESGNGCGSLTQTSTNLGGFCKGNRMNEYLFVSGSVVVVPEPVTLVLFGLGLVGLGFSRRKRKLNVF